MRKLRRNLSCVCNLRMWAVVVFAVVACGGCATREGAPNDAADPRAYGARVPLFYSDAVRFYAHGAYGYFTIGPLEEPLPPKLVVVFPHGLQATNPLIVSDGAIQLNLTTDGFTKRTRTRVLPTGWRTELLSRDKPGVYVVVRRRGKEAHVTLLPEALRLFKGRFTISWGTPF